MFISQDACLQCGESREKIEKENYFCVTITGYETPEVDDEWEEHHYGDWTDEELTEFRIHPKLWDENRRTEYKTLTDIAYGISLCIYRGRHIVVDKESNVCVCCCTLLDDYGVKYAELLSWR